MPSDSLIVELLDDAAAVVGGGEQDALVVESGAPGATGTALTGRTVWVDPVNGADGTGVRGRQDRPFLTLTAAKTAAQSGDFIHVRPGTFDERNLLKDGVNWHFEAGAAVVYTGADGFGAIFDDTAVGANGPVTCVVSGDGEFVNQAGDFLGIYDYDTTPIAVVKQTDPLSNVTIRGRRMEMNLSIGFAAHVVFHKAGTLRVELTEDIEATDNVSTGVRWDGGPLHVVCRAVRTVSGFASYQGTQDGPGTGEPPAEMYLSCDLIVGSFISTVSLDPETRVWANVKLHQHSASGIQWTGGKLYLQAEKSETAGFICTGPGEVWYDAQKFSGSGLLNHTAGSCNLRVGVFEQSPGTGGATPVVRATAGADVALGRLVLDAGQLVGVELTGGARFSGTVDGTAATTGNPVRLTTSAAVLANAALYAATGRDTIIADAARTVAVEGGVYLNLPVSADVTLTGVNHVPTAAPGTNTTQIATTAFVTAAVGSGSAGWTPADIEQIVAARYVAGPEWCFTDLACTVPCGIGDPVQVWLDSSGKGRHLIQTTLSLRPTLQQPGGRWAVRSDGVDDYTQWSSGVGSGLGGQPLGLLVVADCRGDYGCFLSNTVNSPSYRLLLGMDAGSGGQFYLFANSSNVAGTGLGAQNGRKIYEAEVNGASSRVRIDGTQLATGNPGTGDLRDGIRLFRQDDLGQPLGADMHEVIVLAHPSMSSSLEVSQTLTRAYLKSTWGTA